MILRRLQALWTMGTALVRKVLLMPFVRRPGPGPWLARLRAEHLTPTPAGAWPRLEKAGRCIACGLCEAVALEEGVHSTLVAAGRSPVDAPLAVAQARALQRVAADVARVCPARVGVEEAASLILDNARLLAGR
jgi:hypothetical protein